MRMTEKEFADLMAKKAPATPKPAKYRNTKKEVGNLTFDSAKEARRYITLLEWQNSGQITELETQRAFSIVFNGVHICDYVSDFYYKRDGVYVVEDVKSKVTRKLPVYVLKKKLMLAIGIEIQEI